MRAQSFERVGHWGRRLAAIGALAGVLAACGGDEEGQGEEQPPPGPEPTEIQQNLFSALLSKTDAEVDDKVRVAVNRFFGIETNEPNALIVSNPEGGDPVYRCYYELPQDPTLAFIWAADSDDVRSEGMSYGMMIAVQMDLKEQFDKLWKFSETYLQYPVDSELGAWRHYFKWQGRVDDTDPANWIVNYPPTVTPAPDGDLYFAAALYLAHRRWGSEGAINYLEEAKAITSAMLHNVATPGDGAMVPPRFRIIHETENMVTFVPIGNANGYSDPSYHLAAFSDLFALDGPPEDSATWTSVAQTSRDFLVLSAHQQTGLHPDYAHFDGTPEAGGQQHDQFRYDAWRVVMNMAVDYAWFSRDRNMRLQIEKYHEFFSTRLTENNVENQLFAIDGSNPEGGGSTALTATLAAGSLASQRDDRARFVENLWNVGQQSGQYRYYQEGVYLLGLLNTAGKFRYTFD